MDKLCRYQLLKQNCLKILICVYSPLKKPYRRNYQIPNVGNRFFDNPCTTSIHFPQNMYRGVDKHFTVCKNLIYTCDVFQCKTSIHILN